MNLDRHKGHAPTESLKVLLWGGWFGSRNVGDTAILWAVSDMLRTQNPGVDLRVYAFSIDQEYTNRQGVAALEAPLRRDVFRPLKWLKLTRSFFGCDHVVITGGTPFMDSIHVTRIVYLSLANLFRKNTIIFSVGAKPIKSKLLMRLYRFLLRNVNLATARDSRSLELLCDLGLKPTLVPDSAFWMGSIYEGGRVENRSKVNYPALDGRLRVGFAPRLLTTNSKKLYLESNFSSSRIAEIKDELRRFVDDWASFSNFSAIPMHFHGPDSDVRMFSEIMALGRNTVQPPSDGSQDGIEDVSRAWGLYENMKNAGELGPRTYLDAIAKLDLLVGMRLHSLILALSIGIPVVALSYEEKINQIFEDLGLSRLVFDLRNRDLGELGPFMAQFRDIEVLNGISSEVSGIRDEILDRLALEAKKLCF